MSDKPSLPSVKPPTTLATGGAPFSPPAWLSGWRTEQPVPAPLAQVQAAIADAEAALIPADPRAVAVELDRVLAVHGTPKHWDEIADDYLDAFEGVPLDLLQVACKNARLNLKFFPKPGELRAPILAELAERRQALRRLQSAAIQAARAPAAAEPERIDRTPEEIAEAERMAAEAKRALAQAQPMRIPGEPEDLKPERLDERAALRRVREETRGMRLIPKPPGWGAPRPAQPQQHAAE